MRRPNVENFEGSLFGGRDGNLSRAIGGQVGFLKSYVQGFWFRRLPGPRRVVFASRVALGLADGFPRVVDSRDETGQPVTVTVEDLPAIEIIFAHTAHP